MQGPEEDIFFYPTGQNPSISIIETGIVLQEGKVKEKEKHQRGILQIPLPRYHKFKTDIIPTKPRRAGIYETR
jgi:hypothetical protein